MKINKQGVKVAVAVAIPVTITFGYIVELRHRNLSLKWRARYMEEKLNSVLLLLTPEQLERIGDEVDSDIEFFSMAKTTLKDIL